MALYIPELLALLVVADGLEMLLVTDFYKEQKIQSGGRGFFWMTLVLRKFSNASPLMF
jgi:hypothetical protein